MSLLVWNLAKTIFLPSAMTGSLRYLEKKNTFLSPATWRKGDIVVTRVVRPSGWASTFIAVSVITHKLFAISIWNLGRTCTNWKGRTQLILGAAGSKMADWGGHLEKKVFCNKWKTAYLISIIFLGCYVPHPWGNFSNMVSARSAIQYGRQAAMLKKTTLSRYRL